MQQREQRIADKATIYHYQLVKKLVIRQELKASYISISLIFALFQLLMYQSDGLLAWLIGLIGIHLFHFVIIKLTMLRVNEQDDRRWSWRSTNPWFGYMPVQMVEHSLCRRLHRHLLWFGLCALAISYPWLPEPYFFSLICWHVWILAPRVIVLMAVRKTRKDGVLKFEGDAVSSYHR